MSVSKGHTSGTVEIGSVQFKITVACYGHGRGTLLSTARSTLVCLPGQAEVDKVPDMLMGKDVAAKDAFSLHAELRHKKIEEAKTSGSKARIVLARSPGEVAMTIPDTHVVLDVGISCYMSDDDDGCSTLDLEGRNLYDALTKMPLPLLLCPVVLQARKCHVEYAAPAIVALKHEGRWPHKETLDIYYVVERLWHWRYLPACNKHCTYWKRCDKLAHNEHFEEREGLCVADGDIRIRCATKLHFVLA